MNNTSLMPHIPSSTELGFMGSMAKAGQSLPDGASKSTGWGRYGDSQQVHAAPGEMLVPSQVLDQYPEVGQIIAQALQSMGENPNRYVVGSSSNSINPYTGQPEFFFGGLKKLFKKVVKAVAKIPVVGNAILPVAASMVPGVGAYLAPLVAGLQSKAQGGSWGQAIGSAAGMYLGAKIGGPTLGQGASGTVGGTLTNSVGGWLGENISPALASGFQEAVGALPSSLTGASIGAATGAYLGSGIGTAVGGMIDPPKMKWGSEFANDPTIANISLPGNASGGVAIPDGSSDVAPSKGAGAAASSLPAANYLTQVTDRDSGQKRTINAAFSGNFGNDRRNAWGSGVSFV